MKKFLGVAAFIIAFGLIGSDSFWSWLLAVIPLWVLVVLGLGLFLFLCFFTFCLLVVAINYDKVDASDRD
jgi:hypothetical protein